MNNSRNLYVEFYIFFSFLSRQLVIFGYWDSWAIQILPFSFFFPKEIEMSEVFLFGIVLHLIPITLAGLFVAAYLQYRRVDQLGFWLIRLINKYFF